MTVHTCGPQYSTGVFCLTIGELRVELPVGLQDADDWLFDLGHAVVLNGSFDVPVPLSPALHPGRKDGRRG